MCFKYVHIHPCGHQEFLAFQPCEYVGNDDTTHIETYDLPVPPGAPCPVCGYPTTTVNGGESVTLMGELGAPLNQKEMDTMRHDRVTAYSAYIEAQRCAGLWWKSPTYQQFRAHVMQNYVLRRSPGSINDQQALNVPQQYQDIGRYPYGGWQQDQGTKVFRFAPDVRTHVHGHTSPQPSESPGYGLLGLETIPGADANLSGFGAGQVGGSSSGIGQGRVGEQDPRRALKPDAIPFFPRWGKPDPE